MSRKRKSTLFGANSLRGTDVSEDEIRKKQILKSLDPLIISGELEKEEPFEALLLYTSVQDADFIFEVLSSRADAQSIHWLVRYLINLESLAGLQKLLRLLQSESEVIRQEACLGVEHIASDTRLNILIRMLDLPHTDVVCFAARQLGEIGRSVATGSLLRTLRETHHRNVQMEILEVLGKLKDPRSITTLEDFVEATSGDLQKEALLAIGKFAAFLRPGFLRRCLASKNILQREIAYLTILRSKNRRWEGWLARTFHEEKDVKLIIRVLSSVRNIITPEFFKVVLNLALSHRAVSVTVMAQSVLRRVKSARMYSWLKDQFERGPLPVKELTLRLLSEYSQEKVVRRRLMDVYTQNADPKLKLIALDLLGAVEDQEVKNFLLGLVRKRDEFSYPAAAALLEMVTAKDWRTIEEILKDPAESLDVTQLFLNFILRLEPAVVFPETIEECIVSFLNSNHVTVRLLAIRAFGRTVSLDRLRQLLLICVDDPSSVIKTACLEEVVKMVGRNTQNLPTVLAICFYTRNLFPALAKLFATVSIGSEENFKHVLKALLDLAKKHNESPMHKRPLNISRIILLIRNQITKEKALFLDVLHKEPWTDGERLILLRALNATELNALSGLKVDFLARQYARSAKEVKLEYLEFFRKMAVVTPILENTVMGSLVTETDCEVTAKIKEVISAWMFESSVASSQFDRLLTTEY